MNGNSLKPSAGSDHSRAPIVQWLAAFRVGLSRMLPLSDPHRAVPSRMQIARKAALRILWIVTWGSLALIAVLFAYATWFNYQTTQRIAEERIQRSLDVLHEHAHKVLKAADLVMDEITDFTTGVSDSDIRANEVVFHRRFKRMADALPQVQSIWLVARDGLPLISSYILPAPREATLVDRDYFNAQIEADQGTYIGAVLTPRFSEAPTFFSLSRRRPSQDGTFNGVVTVSLLPSDFEKFYAEIGRETGTYFSMIRADGTVLARYPNGVAAHPAFERRAALFGEAIRKDPARGTYTAASLDQIDRHFGYRKVSDYPIYVMAGVESSAIRKEWLSTMTNYLLAGLPITLLLFVSFGIALRRTRSLYAEADRREAAEVALRQSQRLEAIGKLTGGVAHDFNNLLMVIAGSADQMKRRPRDERDNRLLEMIAIAAKRGESLTRQLLTFARRQALTPQVIHLSKRLPDLKDMLQRSLREDVEAILDLPDHVCGTKVDPGELELAILNIAVNARDAMPNGGKFVISVRVITLHGDHETDGLTGDFVELTFSDTGLGIKPDNLSRVFEPFFTTKDEGKGTGLGLSQVYGFAKQSGGTTTISSSAGQGTTVKLYLPCVHDESDSEREPVKPTTTHTSLIGKLVLLVEDNEKVGEVCQAYLEQLECRVRAVSSPPEALMLLQREAPDIVLSDIVMPGGMSGLDFAELLHRSHPALPVVLMTGYSASADRAITEGFAILRKPFDADALGTVLSTALRRQSPLSENDCLTA